MVFFSALKKGFKTLTTTCFIKATLWMGLVMFSFLKNQRVAFIKQVVKAC